MSISTLIFHIWILIFINSDEASITATDESLTSVTVPMTFSQTAQDTIETTSLTFNISTTELWSSDISSHSRIESSTNKTYRSKGDTNADSIGSIIGGSLGGVVFVAITVVVLVCCIKRGNSTGGSSVNIDMQPIDDRLNLPVEINQPRDSLFTDLSFGALLRRSSNRSMKSIKSNRSNRQKNIKRDRVDDRPQYLNRPSQLMAFMWQTIRRRRSRSFTNTNSQNNFKRKVSKSKSLNDLTDELNSKSHLEVHKTCTDPSMSKYNSQSTETISTNDAISIKDDSDIQTDSSINSHPTFEVIVTSYD
ncbi:unnamed protein product [Mytilus edulis]|uniref:Mid2 domain-containing protein n=1 Tax=Mytilus edulis TaxID=6550 RepID=A0A8S3VJ07_MYTED|nr:unnamed protein product [Mytilus edulis]